eukprot:598856-Amphidinium_carterae.1
MLAVASLDGHLKPPHIVLAQHGCVNNEERHYGVYAACKVDLLPGWPDSEYNGHQDVSRDMEHSRSASHKSSDCNCQVIDYAMIADLFHKEVERESLHAAVISENRKPQEKPFYWRVKHRVPESDPDPCSQWGGGGGRAAASPRSLSPPLILVNIEASFAASQCDYPPNGVL